MNFKALAVLLLVLAAAGCQHHKKEPTQKEQAVKKWNQARASVLGTLARSQFDLGNLDKSRQTIDEAVRLDPENAHLRVLSAKLFIEQGQLELADRELTLARKLNEKLAEAEYLNGVVYQRWQKPEQAYECYLRASQKEPTELAYVLARAEMLVAMNCAPEALSVLKSKMEYFEHSPILHHEIGQLLVSQAKFGEAVESLKQATILAPDDLTIREHLAMAHFQNKHYRDAGSIFARLVKAEPGSKRADLWIALGECQLQTGKAVDARVSFETATGLDPSSAAAWLSLAKAQLQLGDVRRTESILRKVTTIDASNAEARLMMGYVRLRQNRMNDALVEFQKASALDRTDPVSLCMMGYVMEKSGKPEQALKLYAQALKLKPDDELASKLMASIDVGN